jgi:hypothetical protein
MLGCAYANEKMILRCPPSIWVLLNAPEITAMPLVSENNCYTKGDILILDAFLK